MGNRKSSARVAPNMARTGTSLHRQVYLVLRDRLLSGGLQPGEQLPPEPALCEQFGVSRITLRRAVSDLEREGLVERVQGRGTFVRAGATSHAAGRADGYIEDLRQLTADTVVKVLELAEVPAPERVATRLKVPIGTPVQRSVRVRMRQGLPMMLLTAWLPAPYSRTISRADLVRQPLNELLAERGMRIGRLLQDVGAGLADPIQAERLGVQVASPLLVVDRLLHDHAGHPVEFVTMVLSTRSRMVFDIPAELVEKVSSGRIVHIGNAAVPAARSRAHLTPVKSVAGRRSGTGK
jgi:GntR family transcriptional regulator